ncbi:MAG: ATP-binding cassette domain-containing protein, partial [Thermotogaceae bacterium]|nr:ATP-binding cassette domain-containing protein [Thermotogaceae bacterium]
MVHHSAGDLHNTDSSWFQFPGRRYRRSPGQAAVGVNVERTISEGTLLQVRDLKISFTTVKGDLPAVRGISFDIGRNSIVGLVGESGCGKSVTALAIMRLLPSNAQLSGTI